MNVDLLIAYFDPSAGSLLLQALVGGGAGIIVLAKYLWQNHIRPFVARRQ